MCVVAFVCVCVCVCVCVLVFDRTRHGSTTYACARACLRVQAHACGVHVQCGYRVGASLTVQSEVCSSHHPYSAVHTHTHTRRHISIHTSHLVTASAQKGTLAHTHASCPGAPSLTFVTLSSASLSINGALYDKKPSNRKPWWAESMGDPDNCRPDTRDSTDAKESKHYRAPYQHCKPT